MGVPANTAYDLGQFSLRDMTECGMALRNAGAGKRSMEEVAEVTTTYLFNHLMSNDLEGKACALARFFVTASYEQLPVDLQRKARPKQGEIDTGTSCLVLLATRGIKTEWNDRRSAKRHQVIPLTTAELGKEHPLLSDLVLQLDVPLEKVQAKTSLLVDEAKTNYNVFYVPDALSAASIESQDEFLIPNGVRSVVGYGGLLPSGSLFTVALFLRTVITRQAALAFRPFALNTKIALLPFDEADLLFVRGSDERK